MGKIGVFSQRIKGAPALRNCTYASMLAVLRYGGKTDFPLAPEGEHQATRAADTSGNPETFTGASFAVKARHGVDVHLVPDQSPAGIKAALRVPGRAYAVAGRLSNMGTDAAGLFLRRWAPAFTGFHAITVVTLGNDLLMWLDPMGPEGYEGDRVTLAQVFQFIGNNYPQDARYLADNELGGDMQTTITRYPAPRTWRTKGGVLTGRRLDPAPLTNTGTFGPGSPALASAEYAITPTPAGWPAGPYQLVQNGAMAGYLLPNSQIDLDPIPAPPSGGITPAQLEAAKKKAAHDAAMDVAEQAGVPLVTEYATETYPPA